jgi:uncharacterized protein YjbI with pentapeptide repeats
MIEIKHRFTQITLCSFEVETIRNAAEVGKANLRGANLRKADLYRANLCGANLCEADLYRADLYRANLCGANLCEADLCGANLCGANLCEANLCEADLCGANLHGANLCGAVVDGETIKRNPIHITCGLRYVALITDNYMRLECKRFTHEKWAEFSDDEISEMDSKALEFWKQWKEPLLAMCKAHREGVTA